MEHEWLPDTLTEWQREGLRLIAADLGTNQIAQTAGHECFEAVEFLKDLIRKKRGRVPTVGRVRSGYEAPG